MLAAVTLDTGGDVGKIVVWAAIAGLVGAVVGELITARGRSADWGGWETPRWRDSKRWYDLGSIAAIPIGIVAGVLAGLLLVPHKEVVANGATTSSVELETLLGVTLLAGLAGTSFLRVLQERFVAVARTQQLRGVIEATARSLEQGGAGAPPTAVDRVKSATNDSAAAEVVNEIAAASSHHARRMLEGALADS